MSANFEKTLHRRQAFVLEFEDEELVSIYPVVQTEKQYLDFVALRELIISKFSMRWGGF